jgi:hypothetical protein
MKLQSKSLTRLTNKDTKNGEEVLAGCTNQGEWKKRKTAYLNVEAWHGGSFTPKNIGVSGQVPIDLTGSDRESCEEVK